MSEPKPSNARGLKKRLAQLGEFSSVFGVKNFQFGEMVMQDPTTGAISMPTYSFSPHAGAFEQLCYDDGWVQPDFDWMTWAQSEEGLRLRNNPALIADANPDQLVKLLTALVRAERYCDGTLADAFETGLLGAIVSRAKHLSEMMP
jgi:uncharacterized protein DUF6508